MPSYRVPLNRSYYDGDGNYHGGGETLDLTKAEADALAGFVVPEEEFDPTQGAPEGRRYEVRPLIENPYAPGETAEEKAAVLEARGEALVVPEEAKVPDHTVAKVDDLKAPEDERVPAPGEKVEEETDEKAEPKSKDKAQPAAKNKGA